MDADPTASATPGGPAAVAETHAGIVFFVGDRAYKLKKPVDLGFLDFRTREARLAACRREVALNRRLAPDVYLGVADVSGVDGEPCDHLVVMRRMPTDRRLSSLVTAGVPVGPDLDRLAQLLARFHETAVSSPAVDEAAGRDADAARWEANAAEMRPFQGSPLDGRVAEDVRTLARRFIDGRRPLYDQRIAAGRARDGHGDLLADDIFCLDDGPRVLDCLEFDDRLRYGDVLADVAFLAMDLERLGRPDLAAHFLGRYQAASGDSWPTSLADHYVAYRAQVRAKVACLRWAQGDAPSAEAADRLLRLCHDHLRRARVRLVLVGGAPGTGKSTVARGVAPSLPAVVLRSDEVRKERAGLDPSSPVAAGLDEGLYGPEVTEGTYTELLARARVLLGLGHSVVLDATWAEPRWRQAAARLAGEASAELAELRCTAPADVAAERVRRRRAQAADPSDATEEVARVLAGRAAPWPTAADVDTSGDPDSAVAAALATLATRERAVVEPAAVEPAAVEPAPAGRPGRRS
ncbi:MAG TPA: AAA family ATPase [Acidimicrobiales bacterium]|nr:AAA family ATPase [Acidimicrobiales bacterium]